MTHDDYFNNGNLPPGFSDEEPVRKGKTRKMGNERKRLTVEDKEELRKYIKKNK